MAREFMRHALTMLRDNPGRQCHDLGLLFWPKGLGGKGYDRPCGHGRGGSRLAVNAGAYLGRLERQKLAWRESKYSGGRYLGYGWYLTQRGKEILAEMEKANARRR